MNTVTLRQITAYNWKKVINLQLDRHQRGFVSPNWYSIIEASFEGDHIRAIYAGNTPVGFVMYSWDEFLAEAWITRLMVDVRYQRRGYGRAAMQAVIKILSQHPDCDAIYISFVPENIVARHLYESLGFRHTGRVENGEIIYQLPLRH
jgi:diamine N-acetyltransferase